MVYVDNLYLYSMGNYGRMKMSHLIADTHEELIAMVEEIGVDKSHIQFEGQWKEHFDISKTMRNRAIKAGAQEITWRDTFRILSKRKTEAERQTELFLTHRIMKS